MSTSRTCNVIALEREISITVADKSALRKESSFVVYSSLKHPQEEELLIQRFVKMALPKFATWWYSLVLVPYSTLFVCSLCTRWPGLNGPWVWPTLNWFQFDTWPETDIRILPFMHG